jgi:hypothetical protein
MLVRFEHVPLSAAIVAFGFSNVASTQGPLPQDLSAFGMPGCNWRVSVDCTQLMQGAGGTVMHGLPIPNLQVLAGFLFHVQALVLDPAAGNAAGAVVSDAATAVVGS